MTKQMVRQIQLPMNEFAWLLPHSFLSVLVVRVVFYFVRACAVFLQNFSVMCLMFWPKMYRTYNGTDFLPPLGDLRRSSVNFTSRASMQRSRVSFSQENSNLFSPESNRLSDASREFEPNVSSRTVEERVLSPQDSRVSEQSPRNRATEAITTSIIAEPGLAAQPEPGMPVPAAKRVAFSEPGMPNYSEPGCYVQAEPGLSGSVELGIPTHSEPGMPSPQEMGEPFQRSQRSPGTTYAAVAAAEPGMASHSEFPGYAEPGFAGPSEPGTSVSQATLPVTTPASGGGTSSLELSSGEQPCEPEPEPDTSSTSDS
jgi:hypothetical protein